MAAEPAGELKPVGSSGDIHDTQEMVTDLVAKKLVAQMQTDTTRYFDSVWQARK